MANSAYSKSLGRRISVSEAEQLFPEPNTEEYSCMDCGNVMWFIHCTKRTSHFRGEHTCNCAIGRFKTHITQEESNEVAKTLDISAFLERTHKNSKQSSGKGMGQGGVHEEPYMTLKNMYFCLKDRPIGEVVGRKFRHVGDQLFDDRSEHIKRDKTTYMLVEMDTGDKFWYDLDSRSMRFFLHNGTEGTEFILLFGMSDKMRAQYHEAGYDDFVKKQDGKGKELFEAVKKKIWRAKDKYPDSNKDAIIVCAAKWTGIADNRWVAYIESESDVYAF